jgi:class 3 adenylate cyclase
MDSKIVAVLFSDVAGYSGLNEAQLKQFSQVVLPDIAKLLHGKGAILELNTSGDAIILVSEDPHFIAHFALDLRDLYRNTPWVDYHLPDDLNCRIGLHSRVVFMGRDPLRGKRGIIGTK